MRGSTAGSPRRRRRATSSGSGVATASPHEGRGISARVPPPICAPSGTTSLATPRASKLLIEDPTSQNALATFLGAFIFSLIGIIVLNTGFYGPEGRVILFGVTIVIVLIILVTFFRWIDYLSNLSRVGQILERVEQTTSKSLRSRCQSPYLGGRPLNQVPDDAVALVSDQIGYIEHLDIGTLDSIAAKADGRIYATNLSGTFVDTAQPMAWLSWEPDERERDALQRAFVVGSERSFEQDPRFGLIALSEIASRALSPGVNDPGTAIDVIGRVVKVLWNWTDPESAEAEIRHPNVFVPALSIADLFDDAFARAKSRMTSNFFGLFRETEQFSALAGELARALDGKKTRLAARIGGKSTRASRIDKEQEVAPWAGGHTRRAAGGAPSSLAAARRRTQQETTLGQPQRHRKNQPPRPPWPRRARTRWSTRRRPGSRSSTAGRAASTART